MYNTVSDTVLLLQQLDQISMQKIFTRETKVPSRCSEVVG